MGGEFFLLGEVRESQIALLPLNKKVFFLKFHNNGGGVVSAGSEDKFSSFHLLGASCQSQRQ